MFASQGKISCEVKLKREKNHPLFVQIEAVAEASRKECRVAIIDITERRYAEDALMEKRRTRGVNGSLEVRIAKAVDELRRKDDAILQDRLAVMGPVDFNNPHVAPPLRFTELHHNVPFPSHQANNRELQNTTAMKLVQKHIQP